MTISRAGSKFDLPASNETRLASFCLWFNSKFRTTDECMDELCRRLLEAGIAWQCCSVRLLYRESGKRIVKCLSCHAETSLTAGTFFHRIKRIRAWLALLLLKEEGIIINPFQFHKHFDVASATAAEMFKKLRSIFEQTMDADCSLVDAFSFASLIFRRSRETPAGQHPISELAAYCKSEALPEDTQSDIPESSSVTLELSTTEQKVYECFSETERMHFDKLSKLTNLETGPLSAALVMLELSELIKPVFGDYYVRINPKSAHIMSGNENLLPQIQAASNFIRSVFQGISLRYLQHYLAEYWYHLNREKLKANFLFLLCATARAPSQRVLSYASPNKVRLA